MQIGAYYARGLRCACGRPAVHSFRVDGVEADQAVPVCWDCGQLLMSGNGSFDQTLFCDFYHHTWLHYDFHPLRHQRNW